MALIFSHKYRFLFTCLFVFRDLQVLEANRSFRFCEIIKYRNLTFTFQSVIELFYNQTQSMCAVSCSELMECSWFYYNVNSTKCSIFNIPTFQDVGPGMMELGAKHYAFTVGKIYIIVAVLLGDFG